MLDHNKVYNGLFSQNLLYQILLYGENHLRNL